MQSAGRWGNSQRPTRTALGSLMDITADSSYCSFLCVCVCVCVQNTTLLRSENFNTALAIRQCRKKKIFVITKTKY